jgi:hypothetical protein
MSRKKPWDLILEQDEEAYLEKLTNFEKKVDNIQSFMVILLLGSIFGFSIGMGLGFLL